MGCVLHAGGVNPLRRARVVQEGLFARAEAALGACPFAGGSHTGGRPSAGGGSHTGGGMRTWGVSFSGQNARMEACPFAGAESTHRVGPSAEVGSPLRGRAFCENGSAWGRVLFRAECAHEGVSCIACGKSRAKCSAARDSTLLDENSRFLDADPVDFNSHLNRHGSLMWERAALSPVAIAHLICSYNERQCIC